MCKTTVWIILISFGILMWPGQCSEDSEAQIISQENESDGNGNYKFNILTSNGIKREEQGSFEGSDKHLIVRGSYEYTSPDGKLIVVHYEADDQGFRVIDRTIKPIDKAELPFVEISINPNVVASLLGK